MAGQPDVTLDSLVNTLAYYVVTPGVYFEDDFTGKTVKALNGADLTLSGFGTGTTKVNDAVVVQSDIFATNGVLHVLDRYVVSAIRCLLVYELIGLASGLLVPHRIRQHRQAGIVAWTITWRILKVEE